MSGLVVFLNLRTWECFCDGEGFSNDANLQFVPPVRIFMHVICIDWGVRGRALLRSAGAVNVVAQGRWCRQYFALHMSIEVAVGREIELECSDVEFDRGAEHAALYAEWGA